MGSNYPLKGFQNDFFEGEVRVLAFVGGGLIPDKSPQMHLSMLLIGIPHSAILMEWIHLTQEQVNLMWMVWMCGPSSLAQTALHLMTKLC